MTQSRSTYYRSRRQLERKKMISVWLPGAILLLLLIGTAAVWLATGQGPDGPDGIPPNGGPTAEGPGGAPAQPAPEPHNPGAAPLPGLERPVEEEPVVTLAIVGDILLGSTVEYLLQNHGDEYPYVHVRDRLQQADLAIGNLETPVTERGEPQNKEFVYRSAPRTLPALRAAGFDLLNLANNHIMDYGEEGLLDTLDHLDEIGLLRMGAGRDVNEAFAPVYIEVEGIRLAFIGLSHVVPHVSWKAGLHTPGVADTYSPVRPLREIEQAKEKADLVVVMAHWGKELQQTPEEQHMQLARMYIDAGADLVVASHAHVLQGFEQYKGKWIAYNLGNFIFTTSRNAITYDSMILEAVCSKLGECGLQVHPIYTVAAQPKPMEEEQARKLYERLTDISFGAEVLEDGRVTAKP